MTDEKTNDRISGKQVLFDAVTLVKDAGAYIYALGKTVIVKIKSMVVTADDEKADDKTNDKDNNG
ncbi:MAG: hypothetical protein K2M47_02470 [Clostridiales bacterium]|nr:hypothetical protein [Clostridiales bacterium]